MSDWSDEKGFKNNFIEQPFFRTPFLNFFFGFIELFFELREINWKFTRCDQPVRNAFLSACREVKENQVGSKCSLSIEPSNFM